MQITTNIQPDPLGALERLFQAVQAYPMGAAFVLGVLLLSVLGLTALAAVFWARGKGTVASAAAPTLGPYVVLVNGPPSHPASDRPVRRVRQLGRTRSRWR